MSGSGGFYKYRCKYFYAKSCQNWVYVNGEACITCLVSSPVHPPLTSPGTRPHRRFAVFRRGGPCVDEGRGKLTGYKAEGCEALEDKRVRSFSPDVCVPVFRDGAFRYALVSRDGLGLADGPGEAV